MKKWWILKILKGIVLFTLAVLLFAFITMHLWNFLVPALFHGPEITFLHALAILALSRILFGGFRGGWGGCGCGGGGWKGKNYWRERIEAKMAQMPPEEKEKFKAQMQSRCGRGWWQEPEDGKVEEQ
jgi:hypothetical protein